MIKSVLNKEIMLFYANIPSVDSSKSVYFMEEYPICKIYRQVSAYIDHELKKKIKQKRGYTGLIIKYFKLR